MKKIIKEIFLYFLVGITSIFSIVILGLMGLPNTIGGKIILWLLAGLLSYLVYIFIPFFKKKDNKYYDGFLLTWAYFVIIIVISFRTDNFEEFDYYVGFSFLIGLPFISEFILKSRRMSTKRMSIDYKNDIQKMFWNKDEFVILEVSTLLNISEYKARKVLNTMITDGTIEYKKNGNQYLYKIVKK